MGYNLISGCHICKVYKFYFRNEEGDSIRRFYIKHSDCIRKDKKAVQTNIDQIQEEDWMNDYKEEINT